MHSRLANRACCPSVSVCVFHGGNGELWLPRYQVRSAAVFVKFTNSLAPLFLGFVETWRSFENLSFIY